MEHLHRHLAPQRQTAQQSDPSAQTPVYEREDFPGIVLDGGEGPIAAAVASIFLKIIAYLDITMYVG